MFDGSKLLVSESFRKKNPHEISSEQIFNEDISGINFLSSSKNIGSKSIFDKKNTSHNISNLQNDQTSIQRRLNEKDTDFSSENYILTDRNEYEYSVTDNSKFLVTSEESNLRSMYNNRSSTTHNPFINLKDLESLKIQIQHQEIITKPQHT